MQIGTNTLLLALAAVLALGLAYVVVASPSLGFGGGLNAAGGCGMAGGSGSVPADGAACGAGNAGTGNGAGNATAGTSAQPAASTGSGEVQNVYVKALGGANFGKYDVNELRVKAGSPVRLHFTAEQDAGCGKLLVVYGLGVQVTSQNGQEAVAEFTPDKAGTYEYSCGMRMFGPGKLIVE